MNTTPLLPPSSTSQLWASFFDSVGIETFYEVASDYFLLQASEQWVIARDALPLWEREDAIRIARESCRLSGPEWNNTTNYPVILADRDGRFTGIAKGDAQQVDWHEIAEIEREDIALRRCMKCGGWSFVCPKDSLWRCQVVGCDAAGTFYNGGGITPSVHPPFFDPHATGRASR